jgi:multisubunit Na+/H+ antiporter MnhB subunit
MADIDVVPKRSSSALIWVLVALAVLALLVWFLFGFDTTTNPNTIGSTWQPSEVEMVTNVTIPVDQEVLPL